VSVKQQNMALGCARRVMVELLYRGNVYELRTPGVLTTLEAGLSRCEVKERCYVEPCTIRGSADQGMYIYAKVVTLSEAS
jgi:hypothetical protein